jgi:hypothetical protein
VDSPGDNLLADFASVVDAVQCGVAIQRELNTRNEALPAHRQMRFRIGINLILELRRFGMYTLNANCIPDPLEQYLCRPPTNKGEDIPRMQRSVSFCPASLPTPE